MINRGLIRLKTLQIVYAYYQKGGDTLDAVEKELFFSLAKAYELYNLLLQLMVEVKRCAEQKIHVGKSKMIPTYEELHPNLRFIENKFIRQLEQNKQLASYLKSQKKSWANREEFIKSLTERILSSEVYTAYMQGIEEPDYEADREVWRKIYRCFIEDNDQISDILEETSLYWNDDKAVVDSFVVKTIRRFNPDNGADQQLLPDFNDEDAPEFARRLLRQTITNADKYRAIIAAHTRNWDSSRVALMDTIIMQMALAEIFSFPSIPVSVSLNEYLEIAKFYSTPKSSSFINGTLDAAVKCLKAENKLLKNV
ncbi:MAG: transcription antitermination protein NusB [Bacteroidales bacterium]|nr:transcription antitermination protein NusB [Bacteroidales bacterium]